MSDPIVSPLRDRVEVRRVIQDALERAHHVGWFKDNWEGSQKAADRIVRELGLGLKDGGR